MYKLSDLKKKSETNIKTCYKLNNRDTNENENENNNILDIRRKIFSHNNILDQLDIFRKKKKNSIEEKEVWDVISNISNYSSDYNRETEKKKILICLGNNNFGQLGSEENDWIGLIDFSTIMINKNKSYSYNEKDKKCKKFNDIAKEIRKRRNSMCNNYLCNNLCNNEIYNQILTSLPSDFHLSTIEKNINKNKTRRKINKKFSNDRNNKIYNYNNDNIKNNNIYINNNANKDMFIEDNENNYNSCKDQINYVENVKKIKVEGDNKEETIRLNHSSKNQNYCTNNNNLMRNKYMENSIKKKFFSENEKNYEKYKEKLKEYDNFLSINKEEIRNNNNNEIGLKNEENIIFNPKIIKCGKYHSAVVSENGFVCLWGLNYYGQLGIDPKNCNNTCYKKTKFRILQRKKKKKFCSLVQKEKTILSPYLYKLVPSKYFGYKHKVKDISLGAFHTLILSYDGFVFTFGCNKKSQLGLPNEYNKKISYTNKPFLIPVYNNSDENFKYNDKKKKKCPFSTDRSSYSKISHPIIYITCGSYHSGVIDANNKLWLWGWNKYGQIDNSYIKEKIKKKGKKGCKENRGNKKDKEYEMCKQGNNIINLSKMRYLKNISKNEGKKENEPKKKEKVNNKNVNIPRNINIKKKKIVQISLGKYHSLCLTEDKSIYVWGCLNKKENEKNCFISSNNYYKNITTITKIKCLSNLHISSVTSSSTHTAFVAPIKYVNQKNMFMKLDKNLNKLNINQKAGDLFRYNILTKNENNNQNLLKHYPYNFLDRGGDNIYYIKYTDLYHLINLDKNGNEMDNLCYKYTIMNDKIYCSNNNNNMLRRNNFNEQLDKSTKNNKLDNILKPLFLTHNNEFPEINSLQIFQVDIGKNFGIFLTSSPSINKILNNKKIDYINNICSLSVLRNKIPERNIFVIGKSDFNQLCLPSNSKNVDNPFYLDKNKLINEVLKRNKKYNFLHVSDKKKYSDQISYNGKLLYIKKYKERIKKSVTNCSLLYNDFDQHKFSLIINTSNSNKNSIISSKLNESNLNFHNQNKKSVSYTQSSRDRDESSYRDRDKDSNNNSNVRKNMEEENLKIEEDNLEIYYKHNLKRSPITSTVVDQDIIINDDSKQADISNISFNIFNKKNSTNSSNAHIPALCNNLKVKLNKNLENEDVSFKFQSDTMKQKKKEKSFNSIKNQGFVDLLSPDIDASSEKSNEKTTNSDYEIIETNCSSEGYCEYSAYNALSTNFKLNTNDTENTKKRELFSLNSYNALINNKACNSKNKSLSNFELKDYKQCSISPRRKSSSLINKKNLFRCMILETIDKINENYFDDKCEKVKLANCEKVKTKFKVFRKRNSCLWNYFTYNETKKNNTLNYDLLEKIVNITLLDVACGDYHSLILLEVDILT